MKLSGQDALVLTVQYRNILYFVYFTGAFDNPNKTTKTRIMNILMQLRKCVNHPYLFEGIVIYYITKQSVQWYYGFSIAAASAAAHPPVDPDDINALARKISLFNRSLSNFIWG